MSYQSLPGNFDEIFERTLNATYDGPVPEAVLHRLVSAVELIIRRELAQQGKSQELAGLRVGYSFQDSDNVKNSEVYWVGWGYHPTYDGILEGQLENFGETIAYPDISDESVSFLSDKGSNFLPDDLARNLVHKLQEEMLRYTPDEALQGKAIYPFAFGHVAHLFSFGFWRWPRVEFFSALKCNTSCNGKDGYKPYNRRCHNNCVS